MSITRDYKNILVINLMHIGELMLVTPVLRILQCYCDHAELPLLAAKRLADLVQYNRHIDECLLIDKKGRDDSLPSFIKYIWGIRKKKFDLVINLHRNERASAIAAFSGADRIVGYAKPGFALLFDQVLPNLKAFKHQIHSHFDVLEQAVGIDRIDDGGLEMWLPEAAVRSAAKIWQENFAPDKKVVAFNIGASWKTKRWIDTYFARCADELLAKGYGVAFFGGPMDTELVEDCIAQMKHRDSSDIKVFTGKVSLGELGALLKRCALFLTTDSGPMHVGVSQNVPVVTMFGASPVPGFYPYDARDVLIKTPEPCHPCGIHECPKQGADNMACMKKITVEIVMQYVWELLGKYEKLAGKMPREYGKYECRVIDMAKI